MNRRQLSISLTALVTLAGLASGTPSPASATETHHGIEATAWSRFDASPDNTARLVIEFGRTGPLHVLTHPPRGAQDINPMISPNGSQVLFERDQPDGTATVGIIGTDGRRERVLDLGCTDPCAGTNDPAWAPDGRQIVYERVLGPFTGPNQDATSAVLYRSHEDGSHLVRLSQPGIDSSLEETHADFSPRGYLVAVRVKADGSASAIFRLRADGSRPHQLTPWDARADLPFVSPATSGPTKDLVTFETEGVQGSVASRVATVPATCGSLADCTRRIRYLTPADSLPDEHFNPAWSADGRRILSVHFSFIDPGPAVGDIETMRFDGTERRSISTDPRFEFRPIAGFVTRR